MGWRIWYSTENICFVKFYITFIECIPGITVPAVRYRFSACLIVQVADVIYIMSPTLSFNLTYWACDWPAILLKLSERLAPMCTHLMVGYGWVKAYICVVSCQPFQTHMLSVSVWDYTQCSVYQSMFRKLFGKFICVFYGKIQNVLVASVYGVIVSLGLGFLHNSHYDLYVRWICVTPWNWGWMYIIHVLVLRLNMAASVHLGKETRCSF